MTEVTDQATNTLCGQTHLPVKQGTPSGFPHFSSKTDLWETPFDFFANLNQEFHFALDVCALPENAKCPRFYSPSQNGLEQNWVGSCWMNPPYGREIGKWVYKAYESSRAGATVVCLLPSRTDTHWWHRWVMRATEIRLVQGRLKFGTAIHSAPFPSAVVVFRPALNDDPESNLCPVVSVVTVQR